MAWREPSEVLGLPRGAPRHEVKAAFRRLALLYHPDVDSSPAAAERFREAKAAADVLLGRVRRRRSCPLP